MKANTNNSDGCNINARFWIKQIKLVYKARTVSSGVSISIKVFTFNPKLAIHTYFITQTEFII